MLNSLFILVFYYIIILISICGYGQLFLNLIGQKNTEVNIGYIGLLGLFFILIYSYLSNIFFSHNIFHNIFFIIFGLIYFLFQFKKNQIQIKKELFLTLIVFSILIVSIFIFKNHDDFSYYHFPYTYYLTQENFHIGIGQFNHGFRTPSSIFYINSLFYLPFAEYYLFNFSSIFFLGFTNIILLKKVHNIFLIEKTNKKLFKINYINYLSLLSIIFINIFFYRISEHGTDRSAQILILVFIIVILDSLNSKKNYQIDLLFTYVLIGLIISLKAFYIFYLIFFIPILYFMYEKNKKIINNLEYLILNKFFLFLFILIFFILFTYFINTGCIIYPVSFTCFEYLSWSIPTSEVKMMNNWYELWSKAGASPNFRVENPEIYIQSFNWVGNWIENYFFNKVSDFLLGLIFLSIIFFLFFIDWKKTKKKIKINKYIIIVYSFLIILTFEWFYNHPALRYGGYSLFALLVFIPLSIYIDSFHVKIKKFEFSIKILILLTIIIFIGRNIDRINNEMEKYAYKPFTSTFYKVEKDHFRIQKKMNNHVERYYECLDNTKNCENYQKKIKIKFGKIIFIN